MKIVLKLISFCLLGLLACQQQNDPKSTAATLSLSLDGQTKIYKDARFSEGKLGSISTITINAGSSDSDYLSLTVYASEPGTYPYKQEISTYKAVSQVEYKINGKSLNNYFAKICPEESGYYSTKGEVKIDEYIAGKRVKGSFSGPLLDADSADECNPESSEFTGEFDITVN